MKNTSVDIIVRVILLILFLIAVFLFKEQTYAGRFVSLVFQSITVVAIFAYMLIVRPRILKDEKNLEIATQPQKAPIGIRLLKLSVIFFIVGILFALGSFVLLFFDPSLYSSIIKTFGTKSHGFDSSCMGLIVPEINLNSRSYPPEMTVYCLDFVKIFIVMIAVTLAIFIMYEFRNKPRVIATVFLLVMAAYFAWSFLGILLNPPATAPSCKLPTGFVCVNYTLHRTGELDFDVGQGTGHSVKITGFTCAQNYSQDHQHTANINN